MKNTFLAYTIAFIIIFALGFASRHFLMKEPAQEPVELPDYESIWKAKEDSLLQLVQEAANKEPVKIPLPYIDGATKAELAKLRAENAALKGQIEPDFLEDQPQYVWLKPKGTNSFERYFSFIPADFEEAQTRGDSIWADATVKVESELLTSDSGQILAKNKAWCKISNLKIKYCDRTPAEPAWQASLSADLLTNAEKEFILGLGAGVYYKPWSVGLGLKASSNATFGAGIIKNFDLTWRK